MTTTYPKIDLEKGGNIQGVIDGLNKILDLAYIDYELWAKWITQGMFFVTRLRQDLKLELIEEYAVPQNRNIRRDQLVSLSSIQGQKECPFPLRRIEVWSPDLQETIVLLTNHLDFGASTIADIYRHRWQIEVFFKTLKQNLHIKTFVGTSGRVFPTDMKAAPLLRAWLHRLRAAGVRLHARHRWTGWSGGST